MNITLSTLDPGPYVDRMAGFSLYISNTTSKDQGHCCYKDNSMGNPSVNQNISCSIYGRYVIYYNERSTYYSLSYLSQYAYNELCEVEVYGEYMQMWISLFNVKVFSNIYVFGHNFILIGYRGGYGDCCQNPCPQNCLNRECDAYTGQCRSVIPEHHGQSCKTGSCLVYILQQL